MDPAQTLNSGQVFLWNNCGGVWYGIDGQAVLRVDGSCNVWSSAGVAPDFFRSADDIAVVHESLAGDSLLRSALYAYPDLRITRQDFFQCVVSFVASSNSNIPRIRRNLQAICRRFGHTQEVDGITYHTFPEPATLAEARVTDITACGMGYRSKYIRDAAAMIHNGDITPHALYNMTYHEARQHLCRLPGVGNKVADCILLFSVGFLEAVPLDRWIVRVLYEHYGMGSGRLPNTVASYDTLHNLVVDRLGPYAGYAQQYLFKLGRDTSGKLLKW